MNLKVDVKERVMIICLMLCFIVVMLLFMIVMICMVLNGMLRRIWDELVLKELRIDGVKWLILLISKLLEWKLDRILGCLIGC